MPGDLVTYTIQLGAQGNVAVVDAIVSDPLPPDLLYLHSMPPGNYDPVRHEISWTAGLWPNAPSTFQVVTQLLPHGQPCERITNTVSLYWGTQLWQEAAVGFDEGCPSGDPQAAFTYTVPACVNAAVHFTNLTSGTLPLYYAWVLDGDGATDSTAEHPAWMYSAAGEHNITLTATNIYSQSLASHLVKVQQPVLGVAIAGPAALLVGEVGRYTATIVPPDAEAPWVLWENGDTTWTTTRSWDTPGWYTITVVAGNDCSVATDALVVLVSSGCISLTGVSIAGPAALQVGEPGTYLASPAPPTATNPAYLWSNGLPGASTTYSWPAPGSYTVTVTATNCLSVVVWADFQVTVRSEFRIYLPLVLRAAP